MKLKYFISCILSGLLLGMAFPPDNTYFIVFIFFAFVPLLLLTNSLSNSNKKNIHIWLYAFVCFLIWNSLDIYWLWHASPGASVGAIVFNTMLMSISWTIIAKIQKNKNIPLMLIFASVWLTVEWILHNWDLDFPWLSLGNVFANHPQIIQWYEYTGILGGSLWIIIINVFTYYIAKDYIQTRTINPKRILYLAGTIIIPFGISLLLWYIPEKETQTQEIAVVQPNIDPYNEKFGGMTAIEQLDKLLEIADKVVTDSTTYLIAPETALVETIWENDLKSSRSYQTLKHYLKRHPQLHILIGMSSNYLYKNAKTKPTKTARKIKENTYYDAYNTALQIDTSHNYKIYHKSKLVTGVEKTPYPVIFGLLESLALDLGGTTGSLGKNDTPDVFYSLDSTIRIAPIICYESVFGEYVTGYIKKGANLLCIITNDGWWENTAGYKQHFAYARLRAIENRRWIVRSANTGISGIINSKGKVLKQTDWWVADSFTLPVKTQTKRTIYSQYGDYIAYPFIILFSILIVLKPINKIRKKIKI